MNHLLKPGTLEWNDELVKELFPHLWTSIIQLKPSISGAPDRLLWAQTLNGDYSTKSGYYKAMDLKQAGEDPQRSIVVFSWKTEIWKLKTTPKIQLMLWKAARGGIAVGTNPVKRKVAPTGSCPRCDEEETEEHVLFRCPSARKVWELNMFQHKLNVDNISNVVDGISKARTLKDLPPMGLNKGPLFPCLLWSYGMLETILFLKTG